MSATRSIRRARGDRGNVSLLIVMVLPALFIAAGLVLDGGRQIEMRRAAHGHAAAAARAAVQLGDVEVRTGVLDPAMAIARASAELGRTGADGVASVSGQTVTVTVTATVDYVLLPGGGAVRQTATASPERGVTGAGP
ncbi:MAG: pilus assembly protein TadG-related protein [Desertimonas sp.]